MTQKCPLSKAGIWEELYLAIEFTLDKEEKKEKIMLISVCIDMKIPDIKNTKNLIEYQYCLMII